MSVSLLLATALTFTPIQPEPVKFDTQVIDQEVRQGIAMELAAMHESFSSKELSEGVAVAQVEKDSAKRNQK
ncbi:hypothetical protein [Ferrimonas lipolytica]|uniref:Uncharacterized protein n=1 Tax=Ferrimonas lipolytica TaxID=2724191 RepID=A0A6H1UFR4_9GAMM|nr:hypothetical protein [Ferrimonas lipolytica]QIZ77056.1 hypothetical protein HER31_09270 [Ferrimonas lipolytica]